MTRRTISARQAQLATADDGTVTVAGAAAPALARGQGVAAWRQIADEIEADIAAGRLTAGAQLPTEAQLAARFSVNRHTVRRAIGVLAAKGLLRATQGRGTFVEARPLAYPIGPRTRFSEIVSREGRAPRGDLLDAETVPAPADIAAALKIAPGAPVLALTSVHTADGTPLSTSTAYYPLPRFAELDRSFAETGSITRAFQSYGIADYRRVETRITARLASPEEALRLDLAPGRIVLAVESVNVDAAGAVIQATHGVFSADRVELRVET